MLSRIVTRGLFQEQSFGETRRPAALNLLLALGGPAPIT